MASSSSSVAWSRRSLLGGGLLVSALGGSGLLSEAARACTAPHVQTSAVPAFAADRGDHRMIVPVVVNGRGPFRFIVDTGAASSVLSERTAQALNLRRAVPLEVAGVSRSVRTNAVRVNEISFGTVRHRDMVMPVLPGEWLTADGYIGLDLIDKYRVTLDFKRCALLVGPPRTAAAAAVGVVAAEDVFGRLRAGRCRVDGVDAAVFIDTGANVSVGNPALYAALCDGDRSGYRRGEDIRIGDVAGGRRGGYRVSFGTIGIADVSFSAGTIFIVDLPIFETWRLGQKPALILGMNLLRQLDAVTIDYNSRQFYFAASVSG